ncbi:MAG: GumC family protein [Fulvimarina manganoxydans]|uniref:GumC family protein n=1 Tax=Fulvimarina manganoxydans TaxID=937218 RepID=UPI002356A803|nr:GumC family protein [Fulvimarina manganoxydans]MCK5933012.1 GumC family protein [Fulvimarina manganoxydans]
MFSAPTDHRSPTSGARKANARGRPEPFGGDSLIDPVFIVQSVWNSKLLIVTCAVLGALIAIAIAMATPKMYTATSQILADPRDIKVVQNEVTPNGLPSEATLALIESQIAVVYSNDVLLKVVREADLLNDDEFNGQGWSLTGAIMDALGLSSPNTPSAEGEPLNRTELLTLQNLRRAMEVSRETKSFVLNLSVKTRSPVKSAKLANLLAETFIDELGRVQSSTARRASEALSGRLEELRQSVVVAERAVEDYKAENRLVGAGGRLVDDDYILRVNDQLARSRGEITALRVKAEQMRAATVDDVVEGSFPEELTSEALNRLRNSYSELRQQQAVLSASLGPRHPQRIANDQALNAAREAIRNEVNRIIAATQTELRRAEQTDKDLTTQFDDLKTKQLATSESFVKLRELEREVEASRAVYEAFLLRARETGEQESLNTANVRIISEATPPLEPSSLSRRTVVVLGFILGLGAGVALAGALALWSAIRVSLRRREEEDAMPASQAATGEAAAPAPAHFAVAPRWARPGHAHATDLRGSDAPEIGEGVYETPAADRAEPVAARPALARTTPQTEWSADQERHLQAAPSTRRSSLRSELDRVRRAMTGDDETNPLSAEPNDVQHGEPRRPIAAANDRPSEVEAERSVRLAEPSSLRGPSSGLRLAETGDASGRDGDQGQAGETDDPNDIDDIQREIEAVKARLNALRGSKRQPA